MENQINFIERLTMEQFKDQNNVSTIEVRSNPKTKKLFMTFGSKGGKVSNKGIPKNPMISLCHEDLTRVPNEIEAAYIGRSITNDKGERVSHPLANGYFYLLHDEGQGSAPVLASF